MRIGLTGWGTSVDAVVEQAKQAEADGFTSLWYASVIWAAVLPVGADRATRQASARRTMDLLRELVA